MTVAQGTGQNGTACLAQQNASGQSSTGANYSEGGLRKYERRGGINVCVCVCTSEQAHLGLAYQSLLKHPFIVCCGNKKPLPGIGMATGWEKNGFLGFVS